MLYILCGTILLGCFIFLWMNYNEEKILTLFGERLKQLRKEKGFSNYEQFAYTYNFNRVQYGRYEKGCNISHKTLLKILSFHNMTLSEFFDHSFDKDPDCMIFNILCWCKFSKL